MAWEATDEVVPVTSGGWQEEKPRTWWDTARSIGQTADDAVRAAANAVTFGMADRLAGAMPGTSTDEQVRLSEEARKRSPYASIAGDVGGAVMLPGVGGRALAARYGGGLAARAGAYGAEGAALGAAQGAGNTYTGNIEDYLINAGKGAGMGGVLGAGGGAAFGARPAVSSARVPTVGEQGAAKTIAYDTLAANRAGYGADYLRGAGNTLESNLRNQGYIPGYSPGSWAAIDRMRNAQTAHVSPLDIETVRKGINRIPRTPEAATDRESGRLVKEALDNFLISPPAGAVRPGTQAEAALASHQAQTARDLAAGEFRAQKMADMRVAAENQAASSYSGLNVENNIRNQVKNFINPNTGGRERLAGYSPEERAALQNIVRRGGVANVGRWAGNIMAGGGGLAVPVVAATGSEFFKDNPALAIGGPVVGLALRGLSNRSARNTIRDTENLINMRNPLYQARAANAPMVVPNPRSDAAQAAARNALTLELLKQQSTPRITVTPGSYTE